MIFRNSPMMFAINTNSKIEAVITFLTYKYSNIELNDSLYYTVHCNNSQFYADGYVMYRDILHASIPSHPNISSIKDIDDSLY